MARLQICEEIAAPQEAVFAVATDLKSWSETFEGVVSIDPLTPGSMGVGTKFRETRITLGREESQELEVIAFNPPHSYMLRNESCGCVFVFEQRFAPTADRTRVTLEINTEPRSLLARLAAPLTSLMMGPMKRSAAADLADLKRVCELKAKVDRDVS